MTLTGAGGVTITAWKKTKRFQKDYSKLTNDMRDRVDIKLKDLTQALRPSGLPFEKLKGYTDPDVYSLHVTGNYKLTMSIAGSSATLR